MKIQGSSPPSKTRKIFLGARKVLGIRKFVDKSEAYKRTRMTRIIAKLPKPASVEPQPVANTDTRQTTQARFRYASESPYSRANAFPQKT